ncbi:hypothetical protein ACIQF6_00215 [Kitasatospora sp. NPDC092948]
MDDIFELDVLEIAAPTQDAIDAGELGVSSSWPFSCDSTRNSRCCI